MPPAPAPAPTRLLTAFLLALLPGIAAVHAADEPVDVPAEATVEATPSPAAEPLVVPDACQGHAVDDPRWFDRAQGYFSQRACTPAVWFDRFFGDEREEDVASALVKVIPSVQYSDRDFTDVGIRLKARVNLPNLRDRYSLVINDDAGQSPGLLPGEEARPEQANAPGQESSAALRYLVKKAKESGADFDIGLRSQLKLFARARYYRSWTHSPVLLSRFTQSLWFRDPAGFGETSLYELERMLAEDMLLRWSTQATVSEEANGLELRDGIQVLRQIDRNRAISWNIAMTVRSDPVWQASAYSTSVRYRQRAFRPWFFFEIEPFVDALREDAFNPNPGIAFRVEFWLGDSRGNSGIAQVGAAARGTEPPAAAGETPDVVPAVAEPAPAAPGFNPSPMNDGPTAAP